MPTASLLHLLSALNNPTPEAVAELLSTDCPEDLREITYRRLHVVSPLVDIPVLAAIPTATAVCACAVTGVDPLPLLEAYPSVCADPTFMVELFIRFFTITDVCRDTPAVTVSWPLEFLSFLDSAVVACLPDHCLSSADQGGPWSAYVLLAGEVAAAAAPGDPFLREVPPQYLDALGEISAPVVPDLLEIIEALPPHHAVTLFSPACCYVRSSAPSSVVSSV